MATLVAHYNSSWNIGSLVWASVSARNHVLPTRYQISELILMSLYSKLFRRVRNFSSPQTTPSNVFSLLPSLNIVMATLLAPSNSSWRKCLKPCRPSPPQKQQVSPGNHLSFNEANEMKPLDFVWDPMKRKWKANFLHCFHEIYFYGLRWWLDFQNDVFQVIWFDVRTERVFICRR